MQAALHPWTFGWDALVAIGTIGLAAVTAFLGWIATSGNRVSRAELEARTMPILESVPALHGDHRKTTSPDLVDYRSVGLDPAEEDRWRYRDVVDFYGTSSGVYLSVPIRNAGIGVARISDTPPRALSVPDRLWTDGVSTRALIPPGEYARVQFRLGGLRAEAYAEVFYSDTSGGQAGRLRLYMKGERAEPHGEMLYSVLGTAMYKRDEERPFAIAGDPRAADDQPTTG